MAESEAGHERQPIKRVRRACLNCRRKKSKCPGELPVCSFCSRLGQTCQYPDPSIKRPSRSGEVDDNQKLLEYEQLSDRVRQLEQMLGAVPSQLDGQSFDPEMDLLFIPPGVYGSSSETPSQVSTGDFLNFRMTIPSDPQEDNSFPPASYINAALDDFFRHSHNQPYSFFHEQTFRSRVDQNLIPNHLLLAVLASAARFSESESESSRIWAGRRFADRCWKLVLRLLDSDAELDISVVQAAALLAIYDFVGCRNRSAWRKIGIAARLAQDLEMMYDPDACLEFHQQEEYRRTFWSIYLLDALATCGRARPPVILSMFCKLGLPCSEAAFRENRFESTPKLDEVLRDRSKKLLTLSPFAKVIVIVTVLSSCAQYTLQDVNIKDENPPWDIGSDFAAVNSTLLDLEGRMQFRKPIKEALRDSITQDPSDRLSAEHVLFSYALFYLSQCLLNHHFLLRRRLQPYAEIIPPQFLSQTSEVCNNGAQQLTLILDEGGSFGCKLHNSFYGYCTMIAGTVNALSQFSDSPSACQRARLCLSINVAFLRNHARYWNNSITMLDTLQSFIQSAEIFSRFLVPEMLQSSDKSISTEHLHNIADYSFVSQLRGQPTPSADFHPMNLDSMALIPTDFLQQ
ncbi:fungal-specific transcription factor domain-containing protein [Xylogone sp. PMI_703]|nr:fungal-specific transcription factor domain-containing protein [Xylogone sp. PMI_703]